MSNLNFIFFLWKSSMEQKKYFGLGRRFDFDICQCRRRRLQIQLDPQFLKINFTF